jgi:hypothetical protein
MAHSSYGFIKPDPEHEAAFNKEQIAGIEGTLSDMAQATTTRPPSARSSNCRR